MKLLTGSLANGGVAHFWRDTEDGGEIVTAQDLSAVIEQNKAAYAENDGYTADRSMRRVGFIPTVIVQKWWNEEGLDVYDPEHAHRLMRKLNDPDWLYLRTAPGTLGKTEDGFR